MGVSRMNVALTDRISMYTVSMLWLLLEWSFIKCDPTWRLLRPKNTICQNNKHVLCARCYAFLNRIIILIFAKHIVYSHSIFQNFHFFFFRLQVLSLVWAHTDFVFMPVFPQPINFMTILWLILWTFSFISLCQTL